MGVAAGLGRLFVGVVVFLKAGVFQLSRRCSATTVHRAVSVCEWPALGMPWGTARSNVAYTVRSRYCRACTGCCGRAGQLVSGAYGFAECWSFTDVGSPLGNYSAQSPASVRMARPEHAIGHCRVKCSLCSVQQVW